MALYTLAPRCKPLPRFESFLPVFLPPLSNCKDRAHDKSRDLSYGLCYHNWRLIQILLIAGYGRSTATHRLYGKCVLRPRQITMRQSEQPQLKIRIVNLNPEFCFTFLDFAEAMASGAFRAAVKGRCGVSSCLFQVQRLLVETHLSLYPTSVI